MEAEEQVVFDESDAEQNDGRDGDGDKNLNKLKKCAGDCEGEEILRFG